MMIYITSEYYSINVDLLALVAALFLWISENLPPPQQFRPPNITNILQNSESLNPLFYSFF